MGDLSTEPSMEEILSSIKRIIAEEGETPPGRARRPGRAMAPPPRDDLARDDDDEVLDLSDPIVERFPAPPRDEVAAPEPEPVRTVSMPAAARQPDHQPEAIVSPEAAQATRGALDQLSRLLIKPEPGADGTLEGMVREMLRPMLREWIDANLPPMVERMVAKEIARITGAGR